MLLAKGVNDKSCVSLVLSCVNISVSLAPHQSSVLNRIWAPEVALTEMLFLPVWSPLLKSSSKGKQVLSFWKDTRRWLQIWQCIISVVFPYWGLSLGFKIQSGAVNTRVFVFTLLFAFCQKSTRKGHLSGKLRSLLFLIDPSWYSFPYWHQQMQVHINLSDLQVFLYCRHSITPLDFALSPSMCYCYIHVNQTKNFPKHKTRFKWKQKVLFYQSLCSGGMLLKKKTGKMHLKILIFQWCCLQDFLAVLAIELLAGRSLEGCFPVSRKLCILLNYLLPEDHITHRGVFKTVSSNPFYIQLSVEIKLKWTFSSG